MVPPPQLDPDRIALFLDFDGTLVDFVTDPAAPAIDPTLVSLLGSLHERLGGALAISSGRPIAQLDRLLSPLRVPMAGVHGFERRDAAGRILRCEPPPGLDAARETLRPVIADQHGLLLEDKNYSVAVHFRCVPSAADAVGELVDRVVATLGAGFERIDGDCVIEIKPAACSKGTAVAGFMREPPFERRMPVCVGDDLTDADAFAAARRHGGLSIAVGHRVESTHGLESPEAVRDWLQRLLSTDRRS